MEPKQQEIVGYQIFPSASFSNFKKLFFSKQHQVVSWRFDWWDSKKGQRSWSILTASLKSVIDMVLVIILEKRLSDDLARVMNFFPAAQCLPLTQFTPKIDFVLNFASAKTGLSLTQSLKNYIKRDYWLVNSILFKKEDACVLAHSNFSSQLQKRKKTV